MNSATISDLAHHVIVTLRGQEAQLRQAGIRHLALFGSAACGDAEPESDIDLAAQFDEEARMDLIKLSELECRIGETLGRTVEIVVEPVENPVLRANINRDRVVAF